MPVTFSQFTKAETTNSTDRVVGYANPQPGGERSWPVSSFALPTGVIVPYAGQTAPAGWLPCDGRSTAGYTDLAAVVGSNVPDLRGYFIRGAGKNADGTVSGDLGAKQQDSIKAHSHVYTDRFLAGSGKNSYTGVGTQNGGYSENRYTESAGDIETRPKNIALNYIIKT